MVQYTPLLLLVLILTIKSGVHAKEKKVKVTAEPSETSRGALGQGFNIHKEDLLTKQFKGTGAKIFEEIPLDECTVTDKLGTIQKDDSFYSSSESLYQSVGTDTKVEGSLQGAYTLGASVGAVTNNIASSEEEVQGLSLNLKAFSLSTGLKKDCINDKPLNKELIKDFEALDKEIKKPWKKSSWRKYEVFLEKYGSHIVKESISGSSIYQYVFAKASKSFSQKDFTVKACLSLSGPTTAGQAEVSACSEVSKKDIEESKSKSMIKKLVVRGGKTETRASLTGELSSEQIEKFLKEGTSDPSPIQYKFYPLWSVLKARYVGKDNFARATNLEQFYKGFLDFGCGYQHTTDADNKEIDIQKFDLGKDSDPEAPTYVCKVFAEGCHNDEDCHYRAAFWCECGGPYAKARTCLRHRETKLKSGTTKKEVYVNTVSGWGWHGCELSGLACYCTDERKNWDETWTGEDNDKALRDVHLKMMAKNRRDQAKKRQQH